MTIECIDISCYNEVTDWQKVASQKKAALIKVSQADFLDPSYLSHWQNAGKAGMARSVWHFYQPNMEPTAQVRTFLKAWQTLDFHPEIIWLDVEEIKYKTLEGNWIEILPPDSATYTSWLAAWIASVKQETGKQVGVYTRASYWNSHVLPSNTNYSAGGVNRTTPDWSELPLWVANYEVSSPALPRGWKRWDFWQYSGDKAIIDGMSSEVDLDYCSWDLPTLREKFGGEDRQVVNEGQNTPVVLDQNPVEINTNPIEVNMSSTGYQKGEVVAPAGVKVRMDHNTQAYAWFVAHTGECVELLEQFTDPSGAIWVRVGLRQWACASVVYDDGTTQQLIKFY